MIDETRKWQYDTHPLSSWCVHSCQFLVESVAKTHGPSLRKIPRFLVPRVLFPRKKTVHYQERDLGYRATLESA